MTETKTIAKIDMAMHVLSSKHYIRQIHRTTKRLKRLDSKCGHVLKEFESGVDGKSIKSVLKNASSFIKIKNEEYRFNKIINENGFILQYRLIKDFDKLFDEFIKVEKTQDGKSKETLSSGLTVMKKIHKELEEYIDETIKLERDQVLNRHFLRDEDLVRSEKWLERVLKREAKHLKNDIRPTKKIFKNMGDTLNQIKKGKVDKKLLNEFPKELIALQKSIRSEFRELCLMQKIMIKLIQKHHTVLGKFKKGLDLMASTGFPKPKQSEFNQDYLKIVEDISDLNKTNLVHAKSLRLQIKKVS